MYKYARDNDLRGAEVITDAKGDRSRRPVDQDDKDLYTRIVHKNADGIVVRGAKFHITGAGLVHELAVMPTKAMGPGEEEYAVSFTVPANTKGVTIINRGYAQPDWSDFDYPVSARENMPDAMVIFDDVLVPWDRVFLAGETQLAGVFAHALGLWERIAGLVHSVEKAQKYVGVAALLAEYHGIEKAGHVQEKLAELIFWAELLRMSLDSSLRRYQVTETGMIYPNPLDINIGKYHAAANNNVMIRHIHDIAGGIVVTLPTEKDLRNENIGPYLKKYLHTKNEVAVEDRMKLINYVRDTTADALGGWNLVATVQAGGGLAAQKIVSLRDYDIEAAKQAAREAAGISQGNGRRW
jgi:4-hydroxybutyryl-CoA dehydratase/vinylacetyl-CoA-Delta-isomerase